MSSRSRRIRKSIMAAATSAAVGSSIPAFGSDLDPLPSWREGTTKTEILDFIGSVTDPKADTYVPPEQRIATFDNDGTLWSEQPYYFQLAYTIDRARRMVTENPTLAGQEPYRSVLSGNMDEIAALGEKGIIELLVLTHSGISVDAFHDDVNRWLSSSRHPEKAVPFEQLTYQPMLELLDYLRYHEFSVFIVSAGGVEFMRPWVPDIYGVPPERVIGSSVRAEFHYQDGIASFVKLPEVDAVVDGVGKPVAINKFIGRRPIFSAGNSDGDLQMLQYATAGDGPGFAMILHHTDAEREWAYDRNSQSGRLVKALEEAPIHGWTVVDMKADWEVVFSADRITQN